MMDGNNFFSISNLNLPQNLTLPLALKKSIGTFSGTFPRIVQPGDHVSISPEAQKAAASMFSLQINNSSSQQTASLQNITSNKLNPNTAIGTLDLSSLGLNQYKIQLKKDKNGSWVSAEAIQPWSMKMKEGSVSMQINIDSKGVNINFNAASDNAEIQKLAGSLTSLFQEDTKTGQQTLDFLNTFQYQNADTLGDFFTGLDMILADNKTKDRSVNENGSALQNYFSVFAQNTNQSQALVSRLSALKGQNINEFLSAAKNSGNEFNSLAYYMDIYQENPDMNFLSTANQAGSDLQNLLQQMDRFSPQDANPMGSVLSHLGTTVKDFANQLQRANQSQLSNILQSLQNAGKEADTVVEQYSRLDDKQFNAFISSAAQVGDKIGALAGQMARVDDKNLDSMVQLTASTIKDQQFSSFLEQMQRVKDRDVESYLSAVEDARADRGQFLDQMKRVQDEDVSLYLKVTHNAIAAMPDLLQQMSRVRDNDISTFLHTADRAGTSGLPLYLKTMQQIKDEDVSKFVQLTGKLGNNINHVIEELDTKKVSDILGYLEKAGKYHQHEIH